jgi:hypothetical protein
MRVVNVEIAESVFGHGPWEFHVIPSSLLRVLSWKWTLVVGTIL